MEYIVVLVTPYFRYLASAPKVHLQAGAAAPASEQEPKLIGVWAARRSRQHPRGAAGVHRVVQQPRRQDEGAADARCRTRLNISCTDVTDEGLRALANLPALTSLNIEDCESITEEGVAALPVRVKVEY